MPLGIQDALGEGLLLIVEQTVGIEGRVPSGTSLGSTTAAPTHEIPDNPSGLVWRIEAPLSDFLARD